MENGNDKVLRMNIHEKDNTLNLNRSYRPSMHARNNRFKSHRSHIWIYGCKDEMVKIINIYTTNQAINYIKKVFHPSDVKENMITFGQ